jgi:hypothetical protein
MHKKNLDGNCKIFLKIEMTADVSLREIRRNESSYSSSFEE